MTPEERALQARHGICDLDCPACSGTVCMAHDEPCDCDVIDRHRNGEQMFYGGPEGMTPVPETPPLPLETPDA